MILIHLDNLDQWEPPIYLDLPVLPPLRNTIRRWTKRQKWMQARCVCTDEEQPRFYCCRSQNSASDHTPNSTPLTALLLPKTVVLNGDITGQRLVFVCNLDILFSCLVFLVYFFYLQRTCARTLFGCMHNLRGVMPL